MPNLLSRLVLLGLLVVPTVACVTRSHTDPLPGEPLTVVVDTGKTMNAVGGQGVGVFVEYRAGGHWHVWWTCDTTLSGLPCDFGLTMTGTALANAKSSQFEGNDYFSAPDPTTLTATTHTTDGVDALDFDATPGTDLKIELGVSGLKDGNFFFFVQDGAIDGNYQGNLTDPLIFEPSTP